MIAAAYVILSVAGLLFVVRMLLGPTVPDRVVAIDGLRAPGRADAAGRQDVRLAAEHLLLRLAR